MKVLLGPRDYPCVAVLCNTLDTYQWEYLQLTFKLVKIKQYRVRNNGIYHSSIQTKVGGQTEGLRAHLGYIIKDLSQTKTNKKIMLIFMPLAEFYLLIMHKAWNSATSTVKSNHINKTKIKFVN